MKNKTTVIISFAAAMIIIIVFNLFIFNRILTSNFASDLESQLLLLGGNLQTQIKRITSLGIACRDIEGFDSQCLELIKKNQHISQAMVIDSQGIIIFHNSPARHGQLFPIQNNNCQNRSKLNYNNKTF